MSGRFPEIRNVSDIQPHLDGLGGIRRFDRTDHTLLNYVFSDEDTFRNAWHLECRGLVFCPRTGDIIARPLHKFFNLDERETLATLPLDAPHRVETKLDGSMVFGVEISGDVLFFTRGGLSGQAITAWARATQAEKDAVRRMVHAGLTPVFEWTAPDNTIVIFHEKNSLTLLAVRERVSGRYLDRHEMRAAAGEDVQIVDDLGAAGANKEGWRATIEKIRALPDTEGVVVVFADGHRIKVKASAYVTKHRAASHIEAEKHIVRAFLDGDIDDVVPLLPDSLRARVVCWERDMTDALKREAAKICDAADALRDLNPKERAEAIKTNCDPMRGGLMFSALKGKDAVMELRGLIAKNASTKTRYSPVAEAFNLPRWSLDVDISE